MSTTKAPVIEINGEKIAMPKPKIKLWRQMVRFTEQQRNGELGDEEVYEEIINLVVVAFNNPKVTMESIEENLDDEDLMAIFNYIKNRVNALAMQKAGQFPNGRTPAGI